jgi:hypothetical protein
MTCRLGIDRGDVVQYPLKAGRLDIFLNSLSSFQIDQGVTVPPDA